MKHLTKNGNKKIFNRDQIKFPLMYLSYGQQEKGTKENLQKQMKESYTEEVYDIFVQAVSEVLPGYLTILNWVNSKWNPEWKKVSWYMPDGFKVVCKPTSYQELNFKLFDQYNVTGKVHGVKQETSALILLVTIFHSTDAYIARRMVLENDFQMYTIHDAFRMHPNDAHKAKQTYNKIMAEITTMNLFEDILSQILETEIDPIKGNLCANDVLEARYSLC